MTEREPPFLGPEGAITLAAAATVAVLTGGLAPLAATLAVLRTARRAGMAPEAPPGRILVLGHRLRGSVPSPVFAVRLRRALVLARSCPRADLVVLGGRSAPGAPSEAEAGRDWLVAHGLDPVRIGMETHSRHTLENLRNHRTTGPASGPEALVTSRLHLHRTLLMARGLGLAVAPVAAEDAFRPDLPALLTEGLMVHWYVTGRLLARLLRRRRWLARIA